MKWWPGEPAPGDMIRVRLGSVYHYGVFVSESEVIQFGPPPVDLLTRDPATITVCATTAEEFACGQIPEIAQPDRAEAKKRRAPADIIAAARARLGESGYDLLRNNCEHFAYECVFGEHYCAQTEDARQRWNSRPILNIYLAPIPDDAVGIILPGRKLRTKNKIRAYEWAVLEYALSRSFGCDMETLRIRKNRCGDYFFSLAHAGDVAAVAVPNGPVEVNLAEAKRSADNAQLFRCEALPRLLCALSADKLDSARFYLYENGTARMVSAVREE